MFDIFLYIRYLKILDEIYYGRIPVVQLVLTNIIPLISSRIMIEMVYNHIQMLTIFEFYSPIDSVLMMKRTEHGMSEEDPEKLLYSSL